MQARLVTVKIWWQAYMEVLIRGEYFSEDAMREQEQYLHHLFLGRFQDPSRRAMSQLGKRWSETLMQRCEKAMLVEKIQGEQQRLGLARRDWVGGGEVKEEEEEQEKQDEKPAIPRRFAPTYPSSPARSHGSLSVATLLRHSPSSLYHNQRWGL